MFLSKLALILDALSFMPVLAQAASTQSIECPPSIPASSIRVVDAEPGWVPFIPSALYLHAAAPMYGPPEMRGDLADFKKIAGKDQWLYTYQHPFPMGNGYSVLTGSTISSPCRAVCRTTHKSAGLLIEKGRRRASTR